MPSFRRTKSGKPTVDRENIKTFGKKFLSTNAITLKDNSRLRLVQRASTTTTCTEYSTRTTNTGKDSRSSSYMPPTKFHSTVSVPVVSVSKRLSTKKERKESRSSFFTQQADIFVPNEKLDSPEYSPRRQRQFSYNPTDEEERRVSEMLKSKKTSRKSSYNPPKKFSDDVENLSHENRYNGSSDGNDNDNDNVNKDARQPSNPATDHDKGENRLTEDNLSRHNESVGGRKKLLPLPLDEENEGQNKGPPTVIYERPKLSDFPGVGSSISSMISDITLPCILNQS